MNPNQININIYKILSPVGYFSITSTLDILISMCILSQYPTDLYDKNSFSNQSIHTTVENFIIPLIKKIKYKD
jgi:hypothetical protein